MRPTKYAPEVDALSYGTGTCGPQSTAILSGTVDIPMALVELRKKAGGSCYLPNLTTTKANSLKIYKALVKAGQFGFSFCVLATDAMKAGAHIQHGVKLNTKIE